MELLLARPRGFCAGVVRAVEIVEQALAVYGPPVYVLHEIVHNRRVVEELRRRGVTFVEELREVPRGAVVIFSAHGVATRVVQEAEARALRVVDATCPLVTKVHLQAQRYSEAGLEVVIIGHDGHPEVEGTKGRIPGPVHVVASPEAVARLVVADPNRLAYVTQTTLSLDDTREVIEALRRRFPAILGPDLDDICYATQNRQNAVRRMAPEIDLLLVVGARNSSNSNRLREVGERLGVPAHLIEDAAQIDPAWFGEATRVGVTAGASAPEVVVQEVLARLGRLGARAVRELPAEPEGITFRLPPLAARAEVR
ncbi:MAG: 4-hydroxy-3-methylbut-2-enyl diphosphate reductase [Nitrospirae bacterium]|nr:MAG: 4-hydroxy-3-methylbut-2-enyl diphosphate reductase [Nitrospirota bacterium]